MVYVLIAGGVIVILILIVLLSPRRFRELHSGTGPGTIDASEEGFESQSLDRGEVRERENYTGD
jgi:hypothetical protein